jgi:hypothetical protein
MIQLKIILELFGNREYWFDVHVTHIMFSIILSKLHVSRALSLKFWGSTPSTSNQGVAIFLK